jgi:NAD(P)-dependent dehydrogenase (short-subunit alcohol dehydrogenase family)
MIREHRQSVNKLSRLPGTAGPDCADRTTLALRGVKSEVGSIAQGHGRVMARIIITGANRGIGLEMCRQLAARGDEVTALCRRTSAALGELGVTVIDGIDVTEDAHLEQLVRKLRGQAFDWLVNNAGVIGRGGLDALDFEDMERQFRVNALGPLRVTAAVLPNLGEGSKVGIVTSRMGSIEDNSSGGHYGYRMSKAAVNMVGKSLSVDLQARGIAVAILHPGMVATDMTGGNGVPVAHAVRGLIERMDELEMATSGSFWHAEGYPLPW